MKRSKALCVLSGGQDSTLCTAIACQKFEQVHAITFEYGQSNVIELESASAIAKALNLASHEIIQLGSVLKGTSPLLVSDAPSVQHNSTEELPREDDSMFVPARNILFLSLAGNRAAVLGAKDIFIGVCEVDFDGGYYDCRQLFISAMSKAIGEGIWGMPDSFNINTPLMQLNKAESVNLAVEILGDRFEEIFALTHTCYTGIKGGCGKCEACIDRDRGFSQAGVTDPIWQFRSIPKPH
jgi:7-cyano-7-deazaguanine synthase